MDKHMSILAKQHIETRFVKIQAEKSPFLAERRKIVVLPTLALIKNTKVDDYVVGFNELGGKNDFQNMMIFNEFSRFLGGNASLSWSLILKIKQLTVLTLAESNKVLPYDTLMVELDVTNVRELEDFLINECMYTDCNIRLNFMKHNKLKIH
ncbi:unnamed protein product [Arabis nemorensis]|uniref:Uncharacterized protein n=1 Tax=Arabis nemorensis TaxID=586526 RepID=A0A565BTK0_9BRAS|nr:unnamed protein product [Arabis nemorensis]